MLFNHQSVTHLKGTTFCGSPFLPSPVCAILCLQALPGNESVHAEQHHEPTPEVPAENRDAAQPEELEGGGTFQPLLQSTFQV